LVRYPQAVDFPFNAHSVLGMNRIRDLVGNVLARRKELGVAEKEATPILAVWDAGSSVGSTKPEINNVYRENEDMVLRMAHVSLIESKDLQYLESTPELGWTQAGGPFISVVYERTIDVAAERERLTKEIAKYEKQNANDERQLSDPAFLAKAPAHIVEGKKKQLAENRLLLEKARAALDALPEE